MDYTRNVKIYGQTANGKIVLCRVTADGKLQIDNAELDKIDSAATDGLLGVEDSLAYRVHEIERHLHSCERWFGAAVVAVGETHVADKIGVGVVPFALDAGNNTWGSWVQVLGTNDTPADTGNVKYDLHKILVTAAERNATYFFQFSIGETGDAGITALSYTESVFQPASNQIDSGPVVIQEKRTSVGTKAWARCMCPLQNTATFTFYIGLHEYQG